MLSSWDDYPIHQTAEPIRNVATSDRNFYDRYYFNLHGSSDELFLVMGMGQYPNLGVQDAFAVVRRGDRHRVVRASRELDDRMDLSVGPFRIEVLEPLHRLRFVLEPNEHGVSFDLVWEGSIPAFEEPRQYIRKYGRVLFDTVRFAQTGTWEGTLVVGDETFSITRDRWKGTRDRSWGVRPVGEPEPAGIRGDEGQMTGMWNYSPMQFDDHSILYILNETDTGERPLEEAVRVWKDPERPAEWFPSGRPRASSSKPRWSWAVAWSMSCTRTRTPTSPVGGRTGSACTTPVPVTTARAARAPSTSCRPNPSRSTVPWAGAKHASFRHCFVFSHAAGVLFLAHDLLPLRFFVCGVAIIGTSRRIFTELLTDHVFRDVYGDMLLAVVHRPQFFGLLLAVPPASPLALAMCRELSSPRPPPPPTGKVLPKLGSFIT